MSYTESDLLMLSGLQHFMFCERQWALIHIEKLWSENYLTAQGRVMHEQVHSAKTEHRGNIRICRSLSLASYRLGLLGQADVIEFHRLSNDEVGISLEGQKGYWRAFPVEYKLGKPKVDHSDEVQLCAQAICLEEMLNTVIPDGAIFYGRQRRRQDVRFDEFLRGITESTAVKIHEMYKNKITPKAEYLKKCSSCSLLIQCMPQKTNGIKNVKIYIKKMIDNSL